MIKNKKIRTSLLKVSISNTLKSFIYYMSVLLKMFMLSRYRQNLNLP